jgi:DNA-binding CsgD family transcriptional regulator
MREPADDSHAHATVDHETGAVRLETLRIGGVDYAVVSCANTAARTSLVDRLSAAERAIVEAVLDGRTNAQIAGVRGTSARTVANQVRSVFRKLGVTSRSELTSALLAGRRAPGA